MVPTSNLVPASIPVPTSYRDFLADTNFRTGSRFNAGTNLKVCRDILAGTNFRDGTNSNVGTHLKV